MRLLCSYGRFYEKEDIHNPKMILVVGILGLVVNVVGLGLFASESPSCLHPASTVAFLTRPGLTAYLVWFSVLL